MIDLKSIIQKNPDCLSSKASFKSVLMDIYPDEKRTVNILTIMYECGIVQRIKSKPLLVNNDFQALLLQLENDYGIISKYSRKCIIIWANALGVVVQETDVQPVASGTYEPIIHKPIVDKVIIEGHKSDYETEVLESGALKIIKFRGFDEREIIIPNRLDGKDVIVIGEDVFAQCKGIERVIIPEGITEIHNGAFENCTALKEVVLPSTLKKLGNKPLPSKKYILGNSSGVFGNCAIEEIVLPSSLEFIGPAAFCGCRKLRKINLPNGISHIPERCFALCRTLEEVLFPDNLISIGWRAFMDSNIERIDIPASVTKVGIGAFESCERLTEVVMHEGVKEIAGAAFRGCVSLNEIRIPRSVTTIGINVFCGLSKKLVIACYAGSYGLEYARKEGYQIKNAAK